MAAAEISALPELVETRSDIEYSKIIAAKKAEFLSMDTKCSDCWQKKMCCICKRLKMIGTSSTFYSNFRFYVYMSREEYLCAGNSGHLLSVMYPQQTHVFIYGSRSESERLRSILQKDNCERVCVLFPGENALTVPEWIEKHQEESINHESVAAEEEQELDNRNKTVVILVDGTWRQARHMAKYLRKTLLPSIHHVTLTLSGESLISSFHRKQSQEGRICTIEALALFVREVIMAQSSDKDTQNDVKAQHCSIFEKSMKDALELSSSALSPVKDPLNWVGDGGSPAWYFGESLMDGTVMNEEEE
mmetsp:Transcript_47277/g.60746  ORF Transcript_47277/g.60746 Transcript_47277/m.60746 type:complete len:304 (+) Transcript_47277:25-936(+)